MATSCGTHGDVLAYGDGGADGDSTSILDIYSTSLAQNGRTAQVPDSRIPPFNRNSSFPRYQNDYK